MRRVSTVVTLVVLGLALGAASGCLVVPVQHSHGGPPARRACPPAHHWEGGVCVHNGKAKGHYKK